MSSSSAHHITNAAVSPARVAALSTLLSCHTSEDTVDDLLHRACKTSVSDPRDRALAMELVLYCGGKKQLIGGWNSCSRSLSCVFPSFSKRCCVSESTNLFTWIEFPSQRRFTTQSRSRNHTPRNSVATGVALPMQCCAISSVCLVRHFLIQKPIRPRPCPLAIPSRCGCANDGSIEWGLSKPKLVARTPVASLL